jgi:UDP-N-acetylmuramoyl-L-alanyl-D-glutamate--2,6-diaminopimelate ligase
MGPFRFCDIFPEFCHPSYSRRILGAVECRSDRFFGKDSNGALNVFFAIPGPQHDGHDYVADALSRGADVAVVESSSAGRFPSGTALIAVENTRRLWSLTQSRLHRSPDQSLELFAATGTDGKTTCAFAVQHLLGESCGRTTTVDRQLKSGFQPEPTSATTANAEDFYAFLAKAAASGTAAVAMEMSSHALAQERLWGVSIGGALFTNLSREHCDFHGSVESYFDAKARLFDGRGGHYPKICAICGDGHWGRRMISVAKKTTAEVISYGCSANCRWRLVDWRANGAGCLAKICCDSCAAVQLELNVIGRFNAINLLGAAALVAGRVQFDTLLGRMATFKTPPGRMEAVQIGANAVAFVDYAHTEAALRAALGALREHFPGKFIAVVFGCGGDRDVGKRRPMAAAVEELADFAIVTADNPRSEQVEKICGDICGGFKKSNHGVIVDRRAAIGEGVSMAVARNGVVLVAGKGHEKEQIIGDEVIPFDDAAIISEVANGL